VRLLARAPILLLLLIGYPVLVALLAAAALQGQGRAPTIALVNLDTAAQTVQVGDQRLSVDDYINRLAKQVHVERLGADQARQALDAGRVEAVLTVPAGFIADLQSGLVQPTLHLVTSRRSPIEGDAVAHQLQSAVYEFNQSLAQNYVSQILRLANLIVVGGQVGIFGRQGQVIGLTRTRRIVAQAHDQLLQRGQVRLAADLASVLAFINATQSNLGLAAPAASAIASPIRLDIAQAEHGREPLSAFGVAAALLASLALVGVLLSAGGIAAEREEHTLARLRRGLLAPPAIVLEKVLFSALACLALGLVLLGAVDLLTGLEVGRWAAWVPVLVLAGASFGAFGVIIGAIARETRTALLAALMLTLPLVFIGLIPGIAASRVAQVVPFGPGFNVFQTLLADPTIGGIWPDVLSLGILTAVFTGAAAVVLDRWSSA
jgi:ABC-type transport system involved in cytochrome c biogenesis permease component